ncbi:Polyketide cyclase / dehydrase and lipid transport [Salegentibacter echinorum]|uniref:Polyketide cyclase / dehydrase and lipid transport n=1 Tax=Salegentibacter echinorum TaxID=1073325 RepID=A0A1M5CYK7_SALEC|nr:SRPBCC family protein [Salegentibacter echinorum]SHF59612.1 Polyketide cyclase / dehydrase and lipid transport [Salegentibacter echinorum]
MTLIFYLLIAFITFIAFLHAWAKKSYDVSRTIVINAPKELIFSYVRQLKKQPIWIEWFKKTAQAVLKFKGEDGKMGATFYWKGDNRTVGEGTQKITKVKPPNLMETRILFVSPIKLRIRTYFAVKELEPGKSKVVCGARGNLPFPLSVMSIFYSPEKLCAADFENALNKLKRNLEVKVSKVKV